MYYPHPRFTPPFTPPLHLERRAGMPLHTQIADQIANRIALGQLRNGASLPPIRSLARSLRIDPSTVTRAYRELRQRRLTGSARKVGTIVYRHNSPETQAQHTRASAKLLCSLFQTIQAYGFTLDQLQQLSQIVEEQKARANQPPPTPADPDLCTDPLPA